MAPARSGLVAVRTDDVENEPRSHFRHGLLGRRRTVRGRNGDGQLDVHLAAARRNLNLL